MQQDRRERKRELDRKAQRAARARNKQHITELEDAVNRLNAELQAERSRNAIARSTGPTPAAFASAALPQDFLSWPDAQSNDMTLARPGAAFSLPATPGFPPDNPDTIHYQQLPLDSFLTPPAISPVSSSISTSEMDFKHILDCAPHENLFPLCNSAILVAERLARHHLLPDPSTDQDILIRSSVQGWDAVHHRYGTLDIGWRLIQAFEDLFWTGSRPLEKLVIKWLCRTVFLQRARCRPASEEGEGEGGRSMPDYLAPTTVQQAVGSNSAVAHYFAWPSVRDLLASADLHYSRRVAQEFMAGFAFRWPYEMRDVYLRNAETGAFTVSLQFYAAMRDLGNFVGRFERGWEDAG